jgi:methylisocitrate lyase
LDYEGLYLSGAAVTASYGVPDIGLLTLDHFANKIKEISLASGLPIIADADTGFGEAEMCKRTVYDYFLAGASG